MTPYRNPFSAPVAPLALGHRRHRLGAAARRPEPPSDAERWTLTGVNVFRTLAADAARLWNYAVGPSTPDVATPSISMPAVGGTVSALGIGQSAYSIAEQGPNPQNVGGLAIGAARLWESGKNLLGFGSAAGAAGEVAGQAGGAASGVGGATSIIGPAAGILGTGLTAYQVATNPTPGSAVGLATSATYTAGYVAASAGMAGISAATAVLGPMFAAVSIPFILGSILDPIFKATGLTHRAAHFPGGYIDLPGDWGDGAAAVDPATGRVLIWSGKAYYWSDQTQAGQPATPEQFAEWGIQPTGKLAQRPGYRDVPKFRDEAVIAKLQDQGTNMQNVREDFLTSYFMEQRDPKIQELHQAAPAAAPGEIWRQYTQTQEYQDEQALRAALEYNAAMSDH